MPTSGHRWRSFHSISRRGLDVWSRQIYAYSKATMMITAQKRIAKLTKHIKYVTEWKSKRRKKGEHRITVKWRAGNSPLDLLWKELWDQVLVVGAKLFNVAPLITLAVQVVRIKDLHSGQHLLVFFVHEVLVCTLPMPGIEAVIPYHSKSFVGKFAMIFEDVI